jgi:hypothetical protein
MNSKGFFLFFFLITAVLSHSQSAESPNLANSASLPPSGAQASKLNSTAVNLFTGIPNISIPIYSFKNNSGLNVSISIDYVGGGIQVNEAATVVGLGWYLNTGGTITRTVRGMPDDMPTYGYLYASAIPQDWRSDGNKYYHDSIDTQQDIFQFNFGGHSGKFFMGKNGEVVVVPLSKIKVIPAFQTASVFNQTLKSFRIISEDGAKYDFEEIDHTTINIDGSYSPAVSGYYGKAYGTSWSLTRIISPFSTDTIKFNYDGKTINYGYKTPQITYVNNSSGARKNPSSAIGTGYSTFKKLTSIELPDKTIVSFVYSMGTKYTEDDYALSKIKISDTAFRFGYLLDYDSSFSTSQNLYGHPHTLISQTKLMLKSVTPYTSTEKQNGYRFLYRFPHFPKPGSPGDSINNKKDYWGFYNGADNGDSSLPRISPFTWGADRTPSTYYALSNALSTFYLPTGGAINYEYELNDHFPYLRANNSISVSLQNSTQNNITLNQVFNNRHQLVFVLDKTVSRTGSAPISGSGNLNIYLKSTDGSVTYISTSLSLYDLFYSGMRSVTFNLANGTYRLETSLSSGTSITGSFPSAINWETKTQDNSVNYNLAGGIRVKTVQKYIYDVLEGPAERYKYVTEDGKSSGFLGNIPRYDFPFSEQIINGGTTYNNYTAISSEPLGATGYAQGGIVGYSRVEVSKDALGVKLGKEVYEFTDLKDINGNDYAPSFPYVPQESRSWGLGQPKRISVYDSLGNLVKRTVNTYQYDTVTYSSSNHKSIKLGHSMTTYFGDPNTTPPKSKTFIGEEYYLTNGRIYLTQSRDTLYQTNGSLNTSYQYIYYDTNYNVNRTVTSYDRSRSLQKETRIYYPYNYTIGGGIGKLRDSAIISQMVATESWILDDPGGNRLVSAAMTSFRQIGNGDIKPDTIYAFESNKPINYSTIGAFDPGKLNRNITYFKPQSFFVSYDSKGNLSEVKNLVIGLSTAVITDYDQQYATAKISNAVQADVAYTSFESVSNGNWTVGSSSRDVSDKLTGKKSYNLSDGNVSKSGLNSSQNYLLTLWVKSGASVTVNGNSLGSSIASQNGWNLYSKALTGITSITLSGSGLIDEVRLHPRDANMETFAYEPLVGVISAADANNTIVYTEYDKLNRIKLIRDKDKNIVKRFDYSDTTMFVTTAPIWKGFDKQCSTTVPGQVDSLYRDINVFSDSSGYVKAVYQGYLDCSCSSISGNPQYKVVNGVCEMGTWSVTASVYKKVLVDGFLQWRWVCTHRYCFSDGSTSTYYEETVHTSSCTLTCYNEL